MNNFPPGQGGQAEQARPANSMTNEELIEALALAGKTWKRATPTAHGYRICGVVKSHDGTDFPSLTFDTAAEASAALDRLNVTAILTRLRDLGPSEEMLAEAYTAPLPPMVNYGPDDADIVMAAKLRAMLTSLLGSPK